MNVTVSLPLPACEILFSLATFTKCLTAVSTQTNTDHNSTQVNSSLTVDTKSDTLPVF